MITYTWSISKLDCAPSENGLTDVVKIIHWKLRAQDDNGVFSEICNSYPLPSPTAESFTNYSTLTEETVIDWLESSLDVGYLQTTLTDKIITQYNPPIATLPLPWMKIEESVVEEVVEELPTTEQTIEENIANGYNPDARDGDGDGTVQEGTEWERPLGTEL